MRDRIVRVVLMFCFVAVPAAARAQERELHVNLAAGTTQTLDVDAGVHRIALRSFLPGAVYAIAIGPAVPTILPPLSEKVGLDAAPCTAVTTAENPPPSITSEEAMAALLLKLAAEVEKCNSDEKDSFKSVTRRRDEQTFDMPQGTTRTVVIKRVRLDDRIGERTWTIALRAPDRGRWLTTYGVGFTPDRADRFFLKAAGANQFVVTEQREHKDALNYIPAVFFTWMTPQQQLSGVSRGPSIGLGVESERPAVFGGYHWGWNHNIGVLAGVSVHQHKRLHGRYTANDVLSETLTDDQLHENVWSPNVVIALTFRLGASPFGGEPKAPKPDPEKKEK